MAVNLSKRSTNGYDYSETIADGENGESILIPNDQCYLLVGSCHVELEPTDEIQMVIKSTRDAEEITLEQFNLHIRPFF